MGGTTKVNESYLADLLGGLEDGMYWETPDVEDYGPFFAQHRDWVAANIVAREEYWAGLRVALQYAIVSGPEVRRRLLMDHAFHAMADENADRRLFELAWRIIFANSDWNVADWDDEGVLVVFEPMAT